MTDLRSIDGLVASVAEVDMDLNSVAFFKMSSASAEQVTLQIRSMMQRAWEYIAIAYQGRSHLALGYASWDQYVDDRLGDLRLTVPREQRGALVQCFLGLRCRSGPSPKSWVSAWPLPTAMLRPVRSSSRRTIPGPPCRAGMGGSTPSAGGRLPGARSATSYTRRRPTTAPGTSVRGGLGPRPEQPQQKARAAAGMSDLPDCSGARDVEDASSGLLPAATIAESVTRAVFIVDELDGLPELVDEIEVARVAAGEDELIRGVRELEHLRHQADAIVSLADRLERIAGHG